MENNVAVDDQSSGWFEVKKKHRSSPRSFVQSSGDLSAKNSANYQLHKSSLSEKRGNFHGKHGAQHLNVRANLPIQDGGNGTNSSYISHENCLDKSVAKQDKDDSICHKPSKIAATDHSVEVVDTKKTPQTKKPDVVPKIKWGDLENDVLVQHNENNFQDDIKFDNTRIDNEKFEDSDHLVSNVSSCTHVQEKKLAASSVKLDICTDQTFLSTTKGDIAQQKSKGVNEVPFLDEKMQNVNLVSNDVPKCNEIQSKVSKQVDENCLSSSLPVGKEVGALVVQQVPPVVSEMDRSDISETPVTNRDQGKIPRKGESCFTEKSEPEISGEPGTTVKIVLPAISGVSESKLSIVAAEDRDSCAGVVDGESLACEINEAEISRDSTVTAPAEDGQAQLDGIVHDELSKVQSTDAHEEVDSSESKERFRERLWCFLFENLNRAVDELYLLCELECDVEQMKEAILVLEEAASDFKELTGRVQEFENVKKPSSQSIDGLQITLKSEHRRPHALSWEVRRMTTSPHKAEILSSSLEAFKKIQQERANMFAANSAKPFRPELSNRHGASSNNVKQSSGKSEVTPDARDLVVKSRKQHGGSDLTRGNVNGERRTVELGRSSKVNSVQNSHNLQQNSSLIDINPSRLPSRDISSAGRSKRESESEKLLIKKDKISMETIAEKNLKSTDQLEKQATLSEKDKEKRNLNSWKSMNAWKEKRNWEDILSSPFRGSFRVSHSPGMNRKSAERARTLHDKLMSPEKKKKTSLDLKKEAEEKHARALRIRNELENERVQKLQRNSEKLSRVNEWQAVRTMKLREGMYARHQRSESRHEAFLAQVARRAGDESSKVNEVRFITSLNEENKKLMLRQKLQDSELRRAEKLLVIKTKQKEDIAREEAVLERRRLIEAEKLQRLAEMQRRKEEAQVRREEERKASSAAREARAIEQLRRREERARAQQEEAELLAQKLAERLRESEQRRKFYLEQIRERASMDFRDQSSPLIRRSMNKEGQGRSTPTNSGEYNQENSVNLTGSSTMSAENAVLQHSLKRRIKKIRQRLMALKYDFLEPPIGSENTGIGYRAALGTARAKIGRWLQELQRLRQARKEGAASIGLITAEMIKFLEGKDPELQASRQAGLLDFIASALPASHTSKPEACQVTMHLLKLLKVVLSAPANRSYFLAQNLLPPIIPMLSAALENYIKIAASLNVPGTANLPSSKTSIGNFESVSEVLDNFLWTVGALMGHNSSDERELQMKDGLLELLIAYQVIHRLRDLFALYDRPQVEGSPFPSSILLSINLLVVLTFRPEAKTNGFINWESSSEETILGFESREGKVAEIADLGYTSVSMTAEDPRPPLSVLNGSTVASALDVSENKTLDESCSINKSNDSVTISENGGRKPTHALVELTNGNMNVTDVADDSQRTLEEKDEKHTGNGATQKNNNIINLKQPVAFLLSAISETGLVSLPSLLTAVLLQANNRLSSEQGLYVLPCNFEEVATGVLKVLNNLALLDIAFMQRMLARPDLKMEFFHLMSFLLSHCTSRWKVASDKVGLLLLESLLLLGYFALFHTENQAVLRWGKGPTILHKVCDLPFAFFSDPELMPVLAGTLVAACYGSEQNKGVVQQELSMDMLLSLLSSCRTFLPTENCQTEESCDSNQTSSELKRYQGDAPVKSSRHNSKGTRGKSNVLGNNSRVGKMRSQRESKTTKTSEEIAMKHHPPSAETSTKLSLRFPSNFINKAEQFFSANACARV